MESFLEQLRGYQPFLEKRCKDILTSGRIFQFREEIRFITAFQQVMSSDGGQLLSPEEAKGFLDKIKEMMEMDPKGPNPTTTEEVVVKVEPKLNLSDDETETKEKSNSSTNDKAEPKSDPSHDKKEESKSISSDGDEVDQNDLDADSFPGLDPYSDWELSKFPVGPEEPENSDYDGAGAGGGDGPTRKKKWSSFAFLPRHPKAGDYDLEEDCDPRDLDTGSDWVIRHLPGSKKDEGSSDEEMDAMYKHLGYGKASKQDRAPSSEWDSSGKGDDLWSQHQQQRSTRGRYF